MRSAPHAAAGCDAGTIRQMPGDSRGIRAVDVRGWEVARRALVVR